MMYKPFISRFRQVLVRPRHSGPEEAARVNAGTVAAYG